MTAQLAQEPAPLRAAPATTRTLAASGPDTDAPRTSTSRDVVPLRRLGAASPRPCSGRRPPPRRSSPSSGSGSAPAGPATPAATPPPPPSRAGAAADAGTALLDLPVSATGTDYRRDGRALAARPPGAAGGRAAADTGAAQPAPALTAPETGRPAPPPAAAAAPRSGTEKAQQLASPDPLARLRDPAELAGCLSALTGPDVEGVPLALDYASFEGAPALVVVLPSTRPDRVDVYTVGAGCRAGDDATLLFTRLPRP